jgi:hypothetical protein
MNFPFIATRFPFLHSLYTRNSSLALAISFHKSMFLEVVLSNTTSNYLIYCFIGVSRVEERTIVLTSDVAYYNSILSSSELSSREQSRSFGVMIGGRVVGGVKVGI